MAIVPPSLIVRLKSHFFSLPNCGVDLIIGLNGYIWISKTIKKALKADGEEVGFGEESGEGVYSAVNEVSRSSIPPLLPLAIMVFHLFAIALLPFLPSLLSSNRLQYRMMNVIQYTDILRLFLQDISPSTRLAITRVSLLISLLAKYCIPISSDIIAEAYRISLHIVEDDEAGVRSISQRAEVGEAILNGLRASA